MADGARGAGLAARAGRMRGRQGLRRADAGRRAAGRPLRRRCARAFAPVRHRRALAARCPPARQRAGMAQAALDDAGIGAGLEPGHGHLDARRPQGQLRRMDAAHEGGPDGAGLSGRSRAGQRGLSGDGRAGRGAGQFLGAGAGGRQLGGQAAVRLLESVARTATFQPQRDPSARLDVLGLLEAEGGYWDGVRAGPDRRRAAGLAQANPLLPLAVLRRRARAPRPNANANGPKACGAAARPRSLSAMRTWTASENCACRR